MKATKTKKVMLTATFLTMTACAGVEESNVPPTGDDSGSDMQPENAGTVTIDPSDFVVQGDTWWTQSPAPRLHGTFDAPTAVTIEVKAGSAPAVTATLTGNDWSAQLATDSITTSNTLVTVTMTATSGAKTELDQAIGLDGAAPAITLLTSKVRDERADQIDFASGEPVHAHSGPEIDLAVGACPSTYKYAYLMYDHAPNYGSESSPNDLAWRIKIVDAKLDTASEQFRVRSDNGQTLIDWSAMPSADANGVSTVMLDRTKVSLLGTRTGKFFIDVKAKDWSNLEATSTICFDHHPLQPPVQVMPMEAGTFFQEKLTTNPSTIASYLDRGMGLVARQRIVVVTTERSHISWTPNVTSTYSASNFGGWVEIRDSATFYQCPVGSTESKCQDWKPTSAPGLSSATGTAAGAIQARLVDDATGETVVMNGAVDFDLPSRALGAPPQSLTLEIRQQLGALKPPTLSGFGTVGLQNLGGTDYVGEAASFVGTACRRIELDAFGNRLCTWVANMYNLTAIKHDVITYSDVSATLKIGDQIPGYVSPNAMKLAPVTWDSGVQYIPGGAY